MKPLTSLALALALSACASTGDAPAPVDRAAGATLDLGNFSVSLLVADLEASRAFYEKLGFAVVGGVAEQKWLVLQNATSTIGLFQGFVERNTLTYNPGWDRNTQRLAGFTDVREIQRRLRAAGIEPLVAVDEGTTGPGWIVLQDPDGNPILIDQHVD